MSEVVSDGSVVPVAQRRGGGRPDPNAAGVVDPRLSSGDAEGPAPATAATLPIGQSRRFLEYVHEHLPGQLPRLCVLVRRMIRSQNDLPVGQLVLGAMPEFVQRSHLDQAPPLQIVQIRVEPNLPQRHDYLQPLQSLDLAIQIWRAV